jgi:NTE family protein
MRVVNRQKPLPFGDIDLGTLLRPNYREFIAKAIKLPLHLAGLVRSVGGSLGAFSTVDLGIALAEALPSGLYSGAGIEKYVRTVLDEEGRTDDFRQVGAEL